MSKKPESYPFLRIAKQYGADYGDVLIHASAYLHMDGEQIVEACENLRFPAFSSIDTDIVRACCVQQNIRNGFIDWLTGETL